jgi:hypothetical protein
MVSCVDSLFITASRLSGAHLARFQSSWDKDYAPQPEPALNLNLRFVWRNCHVLDLFPAVGALLRRLEW